MWLDDAVVAVRPFPLRGAVRVRGGRWRYSALRRTVQFVMLRVAVLAVLAAFVGAITAVAVSANALLSDDPVVPLPVPLGERVWSGEETFGDTAAWTREDEFYFTDNELRRPVPTNPLEAPPVLDSHVPQPPGTNPDPFRVVVLSDSFGYGNGSADLDTIWTQYLQRELDARTAPGAFEVVSIARNGAGTYSEALWLDQYAADHEFDAVMVGFVYNDMVSYHVDPQDCDSPQCLVGMVEMSEEFRECFELNADPRMLVPLQEKINEIACDPAEIGRALGVPTSDELIRGGLAVNPQLPAFTKAVARIKTAAGAGPALVVPLPVSITGRDTLAAYLEVFRRAGFRASEPTQTWATIEEKMQSDPVALLVNPSNEHPGPLLARAYARDAASALLGSLADADVDRLTRQAQEFPPPSPALLSNVLPSAVVVTEVAQDRALVSYSAGDLSHEQRVPCMSVGRPHVRVMFSRGALATADLLVSVGEGSPAFDVFVVGYDDTERRWVSAAGGVSPDSPLLVPWDGQAAGVLLAPVGAGSCDLDRGLDVPSFTAGFAAVPR